MFSSVSQFLHRECSFVFFCTVNIYEKAGISYVILECILCLYLYLYLHNVYIGENSGKALLASCRMDRAVVTGAAVFWDVLHLYADNIHRITSVKYLALASHVPTK